MQSNPQPFTLDNIRQIDGLYCLNDLHKMAGGRDSDKPHRFLRLEKTQKLIKALRENKTKVHSKETYPAQDKLGKKMGFEQVLITIHGGAMKGSYACRELVYAYAMWIDPYFYAMVLKVYDRVVTHTHRTASPLTQRFNAVCLERDEVKGRLTVHGSQLSILGNQVLPSLEQEITQLLAQIQPQLPFTLDQIDQTGGNHDK